MAKLKLTVTHMASQEGGGSRFATLSRTPSVQDLNSQILTQRLHHKYSYPNRDPLIIPGAPRTQSVIWRPHKEDTGGETMSTLFQDWWKLV